MGIACIMGMIESTVSSMSLRARLLLLFGSLLVAVLAAAWWWSTWLTDQLTGELDQAAIHVGQSVVRLVGDEAARFGAPETPDTPSPHVEVLVERLIEGEGRRIRAVHRQRDSRVVEMSVQVDDQPPQWFERPPPGLIVDRIDDLRFEVVREDLTDEGRLRLARAGVFRDIPIPDRGVEGVIERFSGQLVGGLTLLMVLGLVLAAWIAHRVSDPLRRLQRAADRVGRGELGVQVQAQGVSEVDATVTAFNAMSRQLQALEETQQALKESRHLSEIGEIGRGLAHSLRNPLNAIGLTIEELATRAGNRPEDLELATDARRQIRRIDASIRAFLTLADGSSTAASPVDLGEVVRDVALEVVQQVERPVSVQTLLPDEPVVLSALTTELRAMIQALVVNAAEASPPGADIEVSVHSAPEGARVEIADRGAGLVSSIIERLFEPHATTKADGSGMGLYLTRRLAVNRYQGSLEVAARDGGGVRAVLTLGDRVVEAADP